MALSLLDRPGDFIAGEFATPAAADGELVIHSPADLSDTTAIHPHGLVQVERAIQAAREAQPGWRRTSMDERRSLLLRYRDRLRANRESIALTIAREVGKPLWEATGEADAMAAKVDVMLGEGAQYLLDRRIDDLPGEIRHRPLGVIAVVGPFNFPGHLPNGQIIPALLLGNTVVHKPSERTPSCGTWIARCLDEAGLPAGVFNLVQGAAAAGQALTNADGIDGILFTGSAAVGQAIVRDNAHRPECLIALELGGKNAAIALDDCDLEATARAVAFAAFATAGQRCTSTSRLLVTPGVAAALTSRLVQLAGSLRIGHPLDEDIFAGPVISEPALMTVQAAQRAALAGGYEALVAGGPAAVAGHRGYYLRPAIHRAPHSGTQVAGYTERELFGPDLAIHPVADLEQAIELANSTAYGLAASIFSASRDHFERAADGLRVGVLHWNRSSAGATGRLPFGGVGRSGNHRPAGIMAASSCGYALSILGGPEPGTAKATWPGFPAS